MLRRVALAVVFAALAAVTLGASAPRHEASPMTVALRQSISAAVNIPWQGGHGSFSVVNLNPATTITIEVSGMDGPGETVALANYGDSFTIDPVTLRQIVISASAYPASLSYVVSPLVGMTASGINDGPGLYGVSQQVSAATLKQSGVIPLTGNGIPSNLISRWIEGLTLTYDFTGSGPWPPVNPAYVWVSGGFGVTLAVTPQNPVATVDMHHMAVYPIGQTSLGIQYQSATAAVPLWVTVSFSGQ